MESIPNLKITDVNHDCLEKVCSYLCFDDLLSVADTSKHLRTAANLVFTLKYAKKWVHLHEFIYSPNRKVEIKDKIEVYNWKTSYKILRCFGHLISKLDIDLQITFASSFGNKLKPFLVSADRLIEYVYEYCADSLTRMRIKGLPDGSLNNAPKPFSSIEDVHISAGSNFDENQLTRLFPKLRSLMYGNFYWKDTISSMCIDGHFPHLEHMELRSPYHDIQDEFSKMCTPIHSFLLSNPQLQSLTMPFISNVNIIQIINECVPNLQNLSLVDHFERISKYNGSTVHFKYVRKFGIVGISKRFPKIPFTFDHLEEFSLTHSPEDSEEFYTFLRENPSIRKITVEGKMNISRLASALPMVEEIDTSRYFNYTSDEVDGFINQLKFLRKFSFGVSSEVSGYGTFLSCNRNGWQWARFCASKHGQREEFLELTRI